IHVLRRPGKAGLGAAYVAGLQWGLDQSRYDVLVEMDADLSHPPEQLDTFLQTIRSGADVVVGSRYVDGRVTVVNWPISRLLISLFGSWYARTITGLPVRDTTGGFNAFRREVLAGLGLERIESNGYSFQIELKYRAWKQGRRIEEVPIVFTERDSGDSKMSKRIVREAVWRVWKLRLMALLGKL
ncbi:MAG: glycosyltransferase, partial [Gemmatimonadetes bacterium]|nr:glycosyltransferase [Gemmatimonadota bacterium]